MDQSLASPTQFSPVQQLRLRGVEELSDEPAQTQDDSALVFGVTSQLTTIAVLMVVAAPLCIAIPDWLRASAIGCTWGALSLAGLSASWSQRRLLSGIYALFLAQLAQQSLRTLVGLDHNAAWALVIVVLGSGWAVGLVWTPWHAEHRQPRYLGTESRVASRFQRWTIWDIACLATGAAVLSWVVPRTEMPLQLVCQIAPALAGGLLVSLMAVEWACRDRWSLRRMFAVLICGPIACGACLWLATPASGLHTLGWQPMFRWWLTGPGSVMAAQGLTVLGYLATVRVDTHLQTRAPAPRSL